MIKPSFVLMFLCIFLLSISAVYSCQIIPKEYINYLGLEETIENSAYIVIAEKINQSNEEIVFPFGGPMWNEISIKEILKGNSSLGNNIKIDTSAPCGYPGYYPDLDYNQEYLVFVGEVYTIPMDVYKPVIYREENKTYYGFKALSIKDNQIETINISVNEFKERYFDEIDISLWQKIKNWLVGLFK